MAFEWIGNGRDLNLSFGSDTDWVTSLNLKEMGFPELRMQFSKHVFVVSYIQDPSRAGGWHWRKCEDVSVEKLSAKLYPVGKSTVIGERHRVPGPEEAPCASEVPG